MRFWLQHLFCSLLFFTFFLSPGKLTAQVPQSVEPRPAITEQPPAAPDLADLAVLATALSSRLVNLEMTMARAVDISQVERQLAEIDVLVEECDTNQFRALQTPTGQRAGRLPQLKANIKSVDGALATVSKSVTEKVRVLGHLRQEWLTERNHWGAWREVLLKDESLEEVAAIVTRAHETIDTALALLLQELSPLLALQHQAGHLQTRINVLTAEIDGLFVLVHGGDVAIDPDPPMFSLPYFLELAATLRNGTQAELAQISWPGKSFFVRHAWILILQGMLFLLLTLLFLHHRQRMGRTEHWRFVAKRPIAASLLVAVVTGAVVYEPPPTTVIFVLAVLIGSAFSRLLGVLVERGWRKQFGYGLIALIVTTHAFYALGVSLPLFRLYVLMAALVSCVCCLWWAVKSSSNKDALFYVWALGLCSVLFAVIFFTELGGNAELAEFLFVSSLQTMGILLVFGLLRYLVRGVLGWAVLSSSSRGATLVRDSAIVIVQRLTFIFDVLLGVVILSALLTTWQVYDSPAEAVSGLLSVGITVGSQRLTLGLGLVAIGSVGISYFISSLLQRLLAEEVLARRNVETGVRVAVARLVHYALVSAGFVTAFVMLGIDLTQMTLLASALGVGIGFGLQTVVNNFVCGLILLFERPLREGDTIEIGEQWAKIIKIGLLRSTMIRTFDQAHVMVPNTDLITNQVTNWTLTNRRAERTITVGVVYGSNVALVMQTLKECALALPDVTKSPEPWVLFRGFGDRALNFELRVWVEDVDDLLQVESDLHREIDRRFRQADIEIPFPQRDMHESGDNPTNNAAAAVRVPPA
jgi:small-conductance mechanosensitive channel